MRKTILPILVVISFLTLAAVPAMSEQLNVVIGKDNQNFKSTSTSITVPEEEIQTFVNQLNDFKTWFTTARPFRDFILSETEKTEIKTRANEILTTLNKYLTENGNDPITTDWLWDELIETEPGRSTVISIGRGICAIPFYDYETFIGVMLRPMWFIYPPTFMGGGGYTGNFNANGLPPRLEYGDRLGPHILRTTMFTGLYINVGEIGVDTLFNGLIVLLGNARVVM